MKKKIWLAIIVFLGAIAFTIPVQALTFYYDYEYSGATSPTGPAPWLTATFNDVTNVSVPGEPAPMSGVQLSLSTAGLTGSEFVTEWDFNLNPALGDPYYAIADIFHLSGIIPDSVSWGEDAFLAGPDGNYDIEFLFGTAHAFRFTSGQTSVFLITGTGLTAGYFNYTSDPGNSGVGGPFLSGAHVQGIGSFAQDSGWVAPVGIAEPVTMLLLGIGLIAVAGISRKLKK